MTCNCEVLEIIVQGPVGPQGAPGDVQSVNGRVGAVTLTKADVSLSNADNTSDADKPVSTDQAAAILNKLESFTVAASDETTPLTVGSNKVTFRMPYAFTLTAVRASVGTAPTGSVITVDIKQDGVTILSTLLTIDPTEKTSLTAAVAAVIADAALPSDSEISVDVTTVGSTVAGAGLKVTLIGHQ